MHLSAHRAHELASFFASHAFPQEPHYLDSCSINNSNDIDAEGLNDSDDDTDGTATADNDDTNDNSDTATDEDDKPVMSSKIRITQSLIGLVRTRVSYQQYAQIRELCTKWAPVSLVKLRLKIGTYNSYLEVGHMLVIAAATGLWFCMLCRN